MSSSRRSRAAALFLALTVGLGAAACEADGEPPPRPAPTTAQSPEKVRLTFGVWGEPAEIAAYRSMIGDFNAVSTTSVVSVEPYDDRRALLAAVRAGGPKAPDLYLLSRDDLVEVREDRLNVPVDELLDERGVEFGDRYSRDALEAFSADRRLQCMPYGVSPMVIYVNRRLVNFERMAARGMEVPEQDRWSWDFDQFAEAAAFASRPARGTQGVYIEPSLEGLSPFIYSGGGSIFDDDQDPRSLTLADEDTREVLERTLPLLRDPAVTLSAHQLERRTPLEWFERGRLGMIAGYRDLVPRLRQVEGLEFDVLPMPRLDGSATVGNITGICLSDKADSVPAAADVLVHVLSTEAVRKVTHAGFLAPANQEVALTDDFLQPGREPEHAVVYTESLGAMRVPPLLKGWTELEAAVDPILGELMTVPVLDDVGAYTERIDEASRAVLSPDEVDEPETGGPDAG